MQELHAYAGNCVCRGVISAGAGMPVLWYNSNNMQSLYDALKICKKIALRRFTNLTIC